MTFATRHFVPKFNTEGSEDGLAEVNIHQLESEIGCGVPIKLHALYLTKQVMGTVATAVVDGRLVTLPRTAIPSVIEILSCPESVDEINRGDVGFEIFKSKAVSFYQLSIRWVDL